MNHCDFKDHVSGMSFELVRSENADLHRRIRGLDDVCALFEEYVDKVEGHVHGDMPEFSLMLKCWFKGRKFFKDNGIDMNETDEKTTTTDPRVLAGMLRGQEVETERYRDLLEEYHRKARSCMDDKTSQAFVSQISPELDQWFRGFNQAEAMKAETAKSEVMRVLAASGLSLADIGLRHR